MPALTPQVTHPATAWLVDVVPLATTIAVILLMSLLLRGRLRTALHTLIEQRAAHGHAASIEATLRWTPPIVSAQRLLLLCVLALVLVLLALSRIAPLFVALVLAGPALAGLLWLLLWWQEQQYVARLDAALPAAVGRLVAQLTSGNAIKPALEALIVDLPEGPLRAEWTFIVTTLGAPLARGGVAVPEDVVAALAAQTPSRRHATFLRHVAVALGQTQDVLIRRCAAAYRGLHADAQRQSQAATELSMMFYSGVAISLAGGTLTLYLAITQWERFAAAYAGTIGTVVGCVVAGLLLMPMVVGYLLSRADDFAY